MSLGFKGLAPSVVVQRKRTWQDEVKELLMGKTIVAVKVSDNSLTIRLDDGNSFSVANTDGFVPSTDLSH